jgi:hypothetical protein
MHLSGISAQVVECGAGLRVAGDGPDWGWNIGFLGFSLEFEGAGSGRRFAVLRCIQPVIIRRAMATDVSAQARPAQSSSFPTMVLIAGWLVPGAGHLMLRKWIRGGLLMFSIVAMFAIGLALKGKIYTPNTGDLLDILNFAGDLGNGLLYVLARTFDLGQSTVQVATADYGTKFMVVAGLLNIISAVDAHSLATGRKRS